MNRLATLRRRRHSLGWLAVCVFLLQALVPAGFMPVASAQGGLTLMPCPGAGPMPAPVIAADPAADSAAGAHAHHHHYDSSDDASGGTTHEDTSRTHALCAFAAGAAPALGSPPVIDAPVVPASTLAPLAASRPHALGLIERAQSARAPPF